MRFLPSARIDRLLPSGRPRQDFMQTSPNPLERSIPWMRSVAAVAVMLLLAAPAIAQDGSLVLARNGRVIALAPYAPNIVRITLSTDPSAARSCDHPAGEGCATPP